MTAQVTKSAIKSTEFRTRFRVGFYLTARATEGSKKDDREYAKGMFSVCLKILVYA